ncbi:MULTISPECIES: PRC-barrel domain-containing protein [Brevundimonas]|jgi:sporulation protein YlmC with PRC-barrel domain|uniref:PRC-barrel domain-containing protein n=1 Tax=Brevundimonas sp. 357 TaxID=2555782 RepID=UPI000F78EB79|nr:MULTISPECIES: PRC-barrel domain-containing protein [Brevundimonas]RSB47155.1 PRC-barrel domain containing protein [Brevundimonas sp. 357]
MMKTVFAAASAAALLAACSQPPAKPDRTPEASPDAASAPIMAGAPAAGAGAMALGLTVAQLEDADIITPAGVDLGDVQRVDVDASGAVSGLIIEPAGEGGPRWVRIPLDGLTTRKEGDDYDLVSTMTLAQLKALPAWVP